MYTFVHIEDIYYIFLFSFLGAVGSEFGNKSDFWKHFGKCIRLVKNSYYKNESILRNAANNKSDSEE